MAFDIFGSFFFFFCPRVRVKFQVKVQVTVKVRGQRSMVRGKTETLQ